MDISARAISLADRPRPGPFGSPVLACAGKTDPPSRLILSQTSAGKYRSDYVIAGSSFSRCLDRRCRMRIQADWAAATSTFLTSKTRPRARTLQAMRASLLASAIASNVAVQPLLGRLDPGLEPMALPALRLDQHDPCRLNEQNPQVAIAALGYLAEDGAVPSRKSALEPAPAKRQSLDL